MEFFSNIKKKIKSIPIIYENFGLDGILFSLLRNIGFKIEYQSIIDKRKKNLEKKIILATNKIIVNGPYKDTHLNCKTNWGGYDWSSKLLGIYEEQVQKKIVEIKEKYHLKNVVNFGGGDGYHVVGLIKNKFFEKGIVFEIDKISREYLIDNIKKNNLENKIYLENEANFKKVKTHIEDDELSKTLYLIDIEGEEYNIINKENLVYYNKSILIIEDHHFLVNDKKKKEIFLENLNTNFDIEILKNSSRNPFKFSFMNDLKDDDRWLLMSEGRATNMNWMICIPKNFITKEERN